MPHLSQKVTTETRYWSLKPFQHGCNKSHTGETRKVSVPSTCSSITLDEKKRQPAAKKKKTRKNEEDEDDSEEEEPEVVNYNRSGKTIEPIPKLTIKSDQLQIPHIADPKALTTLITAWRTVALGASLWESSVVAIGRLLEDG